MHQTLSANRAGVVFDVLERLFDRFAPPQAVAVHTHIPDSVSWRQEMLFGIVLDYE